jgi:post-segregation antitoxin (ccd killing protein)
MGRKLKKEEDKKQSISISVKPELLEYYRRLHINLSSLVNKLLEEYKENGNKNML